MGRPSEEDTVRYFNFDYEGDIPCGTILNFPGGGLVRDIAGHCGIKLPLNSDLYCYH